jgi:hypothetical protein
VIWSWVFLVTRAQTAPPASIKIITDAAAITNQRQLPEWVAVESSEPATGGSHRKSTRPSTLEPRKPAGGTGRLGTTTIDRSEGAERCPSAPSAVTV